MYIKRVDNKPMVIHAKEKQKIHSKTISVAKIKRENNLKNLRNDTEENKKWKDKTKEKRKVLYPKKNTQTKNPFPNQYRKMKKESVSHKKSGFIKTTGATALKNTLSQLEGEEEIYKSAQIATELSRPVIHATQAGKRRYLNKMAEKRIYKVNVIKKRARKRAKGKAVNSITKSSKSKVKSTSVNVKKKNVAGRRRDKKISKPSTRSRMIQLFIAKAGQEENQDSIGKTFKDMVRVQLSIAIKYIAKYASVFLFSLFILVALVALPIIVAIAVIYNSPFAIFFPSISSGDTTQSVLSAYVAEFNRDTDTELNQYSGYDRSEKVYVNFEGNGTPNNCYDILVVYMVKYGDGDTATDMTDKAKENLKKVFDDMCSYHISSDTETQTDEEGTKTTYKVKYVNVSLKTYQDMISVYNFHSDEKRMLVEMMKPENLAILGNTVEESEPGQKAVDNEQYRAILDKISDVNGKKVVEFVLSKVGYPYSQAYRDSGDYYDCSSLAYYAWKNAGVNIIYEGANTAASEGKYCYDKNYLVKYNEMQPGDLIFYSHAKNGRFMNISHVAVYVGNGMVVEAANERIGVVYRKVQSQSAIVFIGRPR